jgi:hypothetical protein
MKITEILEKNEIFGFEISVLQFANTEPKSPQQNKSHMRSKRSQTNFSITSLLAVDERQDGVDVVRGRKHDVHHTKKSKSEACPALERVAPLLPPPWGQHPSG